MEPRKFFEMVGAKSKGLIVKRVSIEYITQVSYPDSVSLDFNIWYYLYINFY
jgi:hypothetical protein